MSQHQAAKLGNLIPVITTLPLRIDLFTQWESATPKRKARDSDRFFPGEKVLYSDSEWLPQITL